MAQVIAQGDAEEDVGIYISADSVDGLLERFLEYEEREVMTTAGNGTIHKKLISTSRQPQSSVTRSHKLCSIVEASSPRKRPCNTVLVTAIKKRCIQKTVSQDKAKVGPNLKYLLREPLVNSATGHHSQTDLRHMGVHETNLKVENVIPHNRPKTREEMIKVQQSRRIVFLGNLPPSVTEMQIFENFRSFGELEDISLHSKKPDQKYAFVTYKDRSATDKAIADGYLPGVPNLSLCYGGRRHFCGRAYVDFDSHQGSSSDADFDALLKDCAKHRS